MLRTTTHAKNLSLNFGRIIFVKGLEENIIQTLYKCV